MAVLLPRALGCGDAEVLRSCRRACFEIVGAKPLGPTLASSRLSKKVAHASRSLLFTLPNPPTPPEAVAMGVQKKEYNRKEREGKTGDGMGNVKTKGANFYRYVALSSCARVSVHRYTDGFAVMRRRSSSSSASQVAQRSAMPRETSPRPPSTRTALHLSPASSPTGSGLTTRE